MTTGTTRVFALLGDPVAHSLSPVIHNAAFRVLGIDAVYVALRVAEASTGSVMRVIARSGGGGNITAPLKGVAAAALEGDVVDGGVGGARATSLETCNTFRGEAGQLVGTSTDEHGVRTGWEDLGRPPGDWLIVGTGGSASAAATAAIGAGAGVVVRSRQAERARDFTDRVLALGGRRGDPAAVGLVINCTPLGLGAGDSLPLPPSEVPAGAAVLDLVYREGETPWVRALRALGHRAADGRGVLLAQAAASFEWWFPEHRAPMEVMRAALDRALR